MDVTYLADGSDMPQELIAPAMHPSAFLGRFYVLTFLLLTPVTQCASLYSVKSAFNE